MGRPDFFCGYDLSSGWTVSSAAEQMCACAWRSAPTPPPTPSARCWLSRRSARLQAGGLGELQVLLRPAVAFRSTGPVPQAPEKAAPVAPAAHWRSSPRPRSSGHAARASAPAHRMSRRVRRPLSPHAVCPSEQIGPGRIPRSVRSRRWSAVNRRSRTLDGRRGPTAGPGRPVRSRRPATVFPPRLSAGKAATGSNLHRGGGGGAGGGKGGSVNSFRFLSPAPEFCLTPPHPTPPPPFK